MGRRNIGSPRFLEGFGMLTPFLSYASRTALLSWRSVCNQRLKSPRYTNQFPDTFTCLSGTLTRPETSHCQLLPVLPGAAILLW